MKFVKKNLIRFCALRHLACGNYGICGNIYTLPPEWIMLPPNWIMLPPKWIMLPPKWIHQPEWIKIANIFYHWINHVKPFQLTFTVKHGPDTINVHVFEIDVRPLNVSNGKSIIFSFYIFSLNVFILPWIHSASEILASQNGSGWNVFFGGNIFIVYEVEYGP